MSRDLLLFASRLASVWVALYTRGLPLEIRDRRRAELASDVWEHAFGCEVNQDSAARRTAQLVSRLVCGIPADLLWRMEHRAPDRSSTRLRRAIMIRSLINPLLLGLVILLAIFAIANGLGNLDPDAAGVWGYFFALAALTILAGLAVTRRSPRLGGSLIVTGAIANLGLYFWMWPIMLPITVLIIWVGVTRARRLARSGGPAIAGSH